MTQQPTNGELGRTQGAQSGGLRPSPFDPYSAVFEPTRRLPAAIVEWTPPQPAPGLYPATPVHPPAHHPQAAFDAQQFNPSAFAPPRPGHNGPRGGLVAMITVIGAVIGGVFAGTVLPSLLNLSPSGQTWQRVPPASPSATPQPSSRAPGAMPSSPKAVLKANPIYALKVRANCPAQRVPSSTKAFRRQVKALVACENKAWAAALAGTAIKFQKPKMKFYQTKTDSRCGRLNTTFPAAYCTGDQTLYFSTAAFSQGRYYRLAVAQFVMHEYAHHIQGLAGIFSSSGALREGTASTSRRVELQAHCMAHYQLVHSGLGFNSSDRADAEFQFDYTTDASGHGSTKAERYWGRRGLNAKSLAACNTWSVKASRVK